MENLRSVEHIHLIHQIPIHLHIKLYIQWGYSFLHHHYNLQLDKMVEEEVDLEKLRDNFHFHRFHILQRKYLELMKQRSLRTHLNGNLMRKLVLLVLAVTDMQINEVISGYKSLNIFLRKSRIHWHTILLMQHLGHSFLVHLRNIHLDKDFKQTEYHYQQ